MTATWAGALDEFEARLLLAQAVLELGGDGDAPPPFEPPRLPAPFPAELERRAQALLERAAALEEGLGAEQRRLRADLARLPRLTAVGEPVSRFDTQA